VLEELASARNENRALTTELQASMESSSLLKKVIDKSHDKLD